MVIIMEWLLINQWQRIEGGRFCLRVLTCVFPQKCPASSGFLSRMAFQYL